jgi:hypothetical protein
MQMQLHSFRGVTLAQFVKVCVAISLATGFTFGFVLLLGSLVGAANVKMSTDSTQFSGVTSMVAALFFIPLMFGGFGLLTGVLAYLPFVRIANWLTPKKEDVSSGTDGE